MPGRCHLARRANGEGGQPDWAPMMEVMRIPIPSPARQAQFLVWHGPPSIDIDPLLSLHLRRTSSEGRNDLLVLSAHGMAVSQLVLPFHIARERCRRVFAQRSFLRWRWLYMNKTCSLARSFLLPSHIAPAVLQPELDLRLPSLRLPLHPSTLFISPLTFIVR